MFFVVLFCTNFSFGQINLLNAKEVSEIGKKTDKQEFADDDKPLPYGYVDERDILWSIETWETIDLSEKANFPLLFPLDTLDVADYRRSLFDVLIKNIKNGKITDIYADSQFTQKRDKEAFETALKATKISDEGYKYMNDNPNSKLPEEYVIKRDLTSEDIKQYRVRGLWYFDKRQGELKYRLIAIAPVAPDVNRLLLAEQTADDAPSDNIVLFWIFYPKVREILHKAKTFNTNNDSKPISFDHLLNSRMFSGVIYKTANIYGDREIKDYLPENSLFQLLESDKIKEKIRSREQDMWAN